MEIVYAVLVLIISNILINNTRSKDKKYKFTNYSIFCYNDIVEKIKERRNIMNKIEPIKTSTPKIDFKLEASSTSSSPNPSINSGSSVALETVDLNTDVINTSIPGPTGSDGTKYYVQPDGTIINIEGITYEENEKRLSKIRQAELETRQEREKLETLREIYTNSTGEFELSLDNKSYSDTLTNEEKKLLKSVIAAEAINDYDDALAVASVIMNRCDEGNWGGSDPISVITAKGQFSSYFDGYYQKYYNGSVEIPESIDTAVEDALSGIRNNSFLEFRSAGSSKFSDQVVAGGNKYGHEM